MQNTKNEIQVFQNKEFGTVRTVVIDEVPWFVGKDVADALGYSNSRKAITDHVDEEDKGVTKCYTLKGMQNLQVINESGLYALVLSSKLPTAKKFKRWVTSEVLPQVHHTESGTENKAETNENGSFSDNKVQVFKYQGNHVRTVQRDGEPWFVLRDVCAVLGLSNPSRVGARLDDDEKSCLSFNPNSGLGLGHNGATIINEPGLYDVILRSDKPEAKPFRKWVTSEVLPSIRKHGAYMTGSVIEKVMENPDIIYSMADQLLKERKAKEEASAKLALAQPKAEYFDAFVNGEDYSNIRNCGKELGWPQRKFVTYMLDHKYLYRDRDKNLMPSADAVKRGYFVLRDYGSRGGRVLQQTMMTNKGKEHFRRLLAREDKKIGESPFK